MGEIFSITCKNKKCRYHKELRSGVGMIGFVEMKKFEEDILNGKIDNKIALESINNGAHIQACGIYLCSQCHEFINDKTYYLVENLSYSPYGTPRYDITFPFGKPYCKKCGSELEFIRNIRSSKVKCPHCNSELKSRLSTHFD